MDFQPLQENSNINLIALKCGIDKKINRIFSLLDLRHNMGSESKHSQTQQSNIQSMSISNYEIQPIRFKFEDSENYKKFKRNRYKFRTNSQFTTTSRDNSNKAQDYTLNETSRDRYEIQKGYDAQRIDTFHSQNSEQKNKSVQKPKQVKDIKTLQLNLPFEQELRRRKLNNALNVKKLPKRNGVNNQVLHQIKKLSKSFVEKQREQTSDCYIKRQKMLERIIKVKQSQKK